MESIQVKISPQTKKLYVEIKKFELIQKHITVNSLIT